MHDQQYIKPTGWIFIKFDICAFYYNMPRKIFHSNLRTSTLHKDLPIFMIVSLDFKLSPYSVYRV
jgi:hypothetical protein